MSRLCPICGAANSDDVAFCEKCGTNFAAAESANPFESPREPSAADYASASAYDADDPDAPTIPGFVDAFKICVFKKYATFAGRASRSEFWYFWLANFAINFALQFAFVALGGGGESEPTPAAARVAFLSGVVSLALLLPNIGVWVRRMHDVGKSGWNWLWGFVPFVGPILILIFLVRASQEGPNRYGPQPRRR